MKSKKIKKKEKKRFTSYGYCICCCCCCWCMIHTGIYICDSNGTEIVMNDLFKKLTDIITVWEKDAVILSFTFPLSHSLRSLVLSVVISLRHRLHAHTFPSRASPVESRYQKAVRLPYRQHALCIYNCHNCQLSFGTTSMVPLNLLRNSQCFGIPLRFSFFSFLCKCDIGISHSQLI